MMLFALILATLHAHATPPLAAPASAPRTLEQIVRDVTPDIQAQPKCTNPPRVGCAELSKFPHAKTTDLPGLGGAGHTICGPGLASEEADACRPQAGGEIINRYANSFVAPRSADRLSSGFVDVTAAGARKKSAPPRDGSDPVGNLIDQVNRTDVPRAIGKINKQFTDLRAASVDRCCGSNSSCRTSFSQVPLKFCRPSVSDPCTTGAQFRHATVSRAQWEVLGAQARKLKVHRPLSPAESASLDDAIATTSTIDPMAALGGPVPTNKIPRPDSGFRRNPAVCERNRLRNRFADASTRTQSRVQFHPAPNRNDDNSGRVGVRWTLGYALPA